MLRSYEGTAPGDWNVFDAAKTKGGMGLHFFTKHKAWAEFFTGLDKTEGRSPGGYRFIPAYLKVNKAWDIKNPEHRALIEDIVPAS